MRFSSWSRNAARASVWAGLVLLSAQSALAQPAPPLFVTPAPALDARVADTPRTARARRLALRTDVLGAALLSGAPVRAPFTLNLFDDVSLTLDRERLENDGRGHTSWVGHVAGDTTSAAALTWNGGYLLGSVVTGGIAYQLTSEADGAVLVRELTATAAPEGRPARVPPDRAMLRADQLAGPAAVTSTIDVLVLYTAAARAKAGGTSAMLAAIANSFAVTNAAFQRSGVNAAVRQASAIEVPYVEATGGSFPIDTDLDVISPGSAASAAVEAARDTTGADLVSLITGRTGGAACGVAWLGPSTFAAYSVVEQECLSAGQWSFSHELAHNFGANHAPGDGGGPPPSVPYAQGYRSGAIRTLMAYAGSGTYYPRIMNYSSATVLEPAGSGLPTGTSVQDNARRLNETAATLAAFKGAAVSAPPPPTAFAAAVAGTTLTLSWTPAAIGGAITSFDLEAGPTPGSGAFGHAAFTQSPVVVPNVPPGTYYLRLRSVGPGGSSAPTPDAVAVVTSACTPPGPATLSAVVSGGTVTLSWSAPPGSAAVSYALGVGTAPGVDNLGVFAMGGATTFTGPAPRGTYYLRVVASNACGTGPVSPVVPFTIP